MLSRTLFALAAAAACSLVSTGCNQNSTTTIGAGKRTPIQKICGRAYTGREGAHNKALRALTPEQRKQVQPLPSKEEFIELCATLPEDAARCLDPNIVAVDTVACKKAIEAAPEDKVDAIKALLSGTDDEPAAEEAGSEEAGSEAGEGSAEEAGSEEAGAE